MRTCRFCEKEIGDHDKLCVNCGYNPQTDTMTAGFVKKKVNPGLDRKNYQVSSGVKSFAFWSLVVIVFSLGFQYQRKIGDLFWGAKNNLTGKKVSSTAALGKGQGSQGRPVKLIDVRSYKAPVDKTPGKNRKIEGIFYDPQGKSYVVINGQLICETQSFADMVVKKINSDSVEVIQAGKESVLKLNQ
jgi:hypothetical protein